MARRRHEAAEIDSFLPAGVTTDAPPFEMTALSLPLARFDSARRRPLHIEARLSDRQGRALQRLLGGLDAKFGAGWRTRDFGFADVVRWLLDQIGDDDDR